MAEHCLLWEAKFLSGGNAIWLILTRHTVCSQIVFDCGILIQQQGLEEGIMLFTAHVLVNARMPLTPKQEEKKKKKKKEEEEEEEEGEEEEEEEEEEKEEEGRRRRRI
ncbi:hypothetical protein TcWFU_002126 [Taenia crassiceps]|uniref:Uncharacterized protein n=1 Tax=Taenia crassiceps TaxID=6207 RepID=A0ABR4Q4S6_9CEST